MTSKNARLAGREVAIIIGLFIAILVGIGYWSYTRRSEPELELIFLRYSNQGRTDVGVGRAAFLLLTNRTSNTFMMCLPAGQRTFVLSTNTLGATVALKDPKVTAMHSNPWNQYETSWEVNCAFQDKTARGATNWIQKRLASPGVNIFLPIGPQTGVVVRVQLPRNVTERRVAVLLDDSASNPPTWKEKRWANVVRPILNNGALQVWCEASLKYPGRTDGKPDVLGE